MRVQDRYLDLMKKSLVRSFDTDEQKVIREAGLVWPTYAETMIGLKRLDNLQACLETIIKDNIEGDVIECGVWRGGACIFMKAVLEVLEEHRVVYVADSFQGFEKIGDLRYDIDKGADFLTESILSVSKKEVEGNFAKYNLLDDNVKFIEGYFANTMPKFEGRLSLLRVDCDLYGATTEVLNHLYDRVSVGGYIIIDDYSSILNCASAVHHFRHRRNISTKIMQIDHSAVYWRKEK
jgi:hypothetical protein